jgi:hypothetical protein
MNAFWLIDMSGDVAVGREGMFEIGAVPVVVGP